MKKRMPVVAGSLCILLVGALYFLYPKIGTNRSPENDPGDPVNTVEVNSKPESNRDIHSTTDVIAPATPTASPEAAGIRTGQDPEDVVATIHHLQAQIEQAIIPPVWIRQTITVIHERDHSTWMAPPGGPAIPDDYITETWYHVNADRVVDQYVKADKTLDGQVYQQVVFNAGVARNLTTLETHDMTPFPAWTFDTGGLERALAFAFRNPHTVALEQLDGREVVRITFEEQYPKPMSLDGLDQKVTKLIGHHYYDPETGFMTNEEDFAVCEDGSLRVITQISVEITTASTPPTEVLDLLQP